VRNGSSKVYRWVCLLEDALEQVPLGRGQAARYLHGKGHNGVVMSFCSVVGRDGKQGFGSDEGEVLRKREGNYVVSKWRYEANDVKGCMRFQNAVRNSRAEIRSERHGLLLLRKCWIISRAK
jgi:hypothetical protein